NKEKSVVYDENENDCIDSFRTDMLLDYLDEKEKDQPFFFYMSYRISHVREQYIRDKELYADKDWSEKVRIYAARVTLLDIQVGRVLKKLEEISELDNTLVIFTSDNGAEHSWDLFDSTAGLRGKKRDMYEGGVRAPLLVYWKGKILPGAVSDHLSAAWDFMPTFAEVAGVERPSRTDGISMLPTLLGKNGQQKKHDYLYWEIQLDGWWHTMPKTGGFRQGVRKGDWKAVRYGSNQPTELYNLSSDEAEKKNVAKQHPEIVEQMEALFKDARTETDGFPYGGVMQDMDAQDEYKGWIRPKPRQ
ncbi:MAG: sulfatase-like hydrolase/transferase, partial [Verrucomicrobiota bacterium]|nr:sulfatase-like hydrolase/transferase [Verrucomicrobiota bacterium]